jgi:hypothetical protein
MAIELNLAGGKTAYEDMIDSFGKTLVKTPVTKTTSNTSGDETLTDGTNVNITGTFYKAEDYYSRDKEALFNGADAVVMVKSAVTINRDDKITYNSEVFRVNEVEQRYLGTIEFYKVVRCYKVD